MATRGWGPRGPLVLAAVVSVVLLSTVVLTGRTVARARDGAARGLGDGFEIAGREQLRRLGQLDAAALEEFLEEQRADGLRYVAILDDAGRVVVEAGAARGSSTEPGLTSLGERARLVTRRTSPRGREARRALVYEFEPTVANQLADESRLLLIVAVGASLAVIGLALWLSRGLRARERLQAELERGRRLAALGEMSAVLSHELRNPLASLKGHAQLLVETLPDPSPALKKARRIVDESVRLEALANGLLDFVRSGELNRAPADPAALVRDAAAEVEGPIDVEAEGAPPTWTIDAPRLRQSLVNVLRNAVQASPEDGRVTARVAADGGRLVITVRDRGDGIPPDDLAAVFEPFHTRKARGVGLGLAIARRIVEQHGGTLTAANHPDGGAELRFALPRSA